MPQDGAFSSPLALPRRTWTDTLRRTAAGFRRDKLNHLGAALTYYAVLSLFPALLVLVSLVGLFADPARVTRILTATVSQLGPASAAKTFQGPIHSITAHRGTAGGAVVFLMWLWITNMAILFGAEFNAETERSRQIESGVPHARRRLRMDEREPAEVR